MNNVPFACLPMVDAENQVLGRAGICSSTLKVTSTGTVDAACYLLPKVLGCCLDRASAQAALPDLDGFSPLVLADKLLPILETLPPLAEPGLESEEQKKCLHTIQALRAKTLLDLDRDVASRARDQVHGQQSAIRTVLLQVYGNSPSAVKQVIEQLRGSLDRTRSGEPDWQPLTRWQELHRMADKLRQRRSKLPPSTAKAALDAIASAGRELFRPALRALALEHVQPTWQDEKNQLVAFLDDIAKRSTQALHSLPAVRQAAEAIHAAVAAEQHVSRASVVKAVEGPTRDQVLAGLQGHLHVVDENALIRRLAEELDLGLRTSCAEVCPWLNPQAVLPDLLRDFPPKTLAKLFISLVEDSRGPGQSFFESVDREGVEPCIGRLYELAEPTVDLSGRDQHQVGITPTHLCIVSLPKAVGPKDHGIIEHIREAFLAHNKHTAFTQASPTDRTITVVRLLIGFPIVIEGQTPALLNHYLAASKNGHLVHLFDLLPESPEGEALDEYHALAPFALEQEELTL